MMEPTESGLIRSFDGTRIRYDIYGQGTLPIVLCNGLGVSIGFWKYLINHFSRDYKVVTWDYRGHGRSDAPPSLFNLTVETNVRDLDAVVDHLDLAPAIFIGHSMGVQVILEFYNRHPGRVRALVPLSGAYGRPFNDFYNRDYFPAWLPLLFLTANGMSRPSDYIWKSLLKYPLAYTVAQLLAAISPHACPKEDMDPYFRHMSGLDVRVFVNMAYWLQAHSAEAYLEKIKVPTLVIAGTKDHLTPYRNSVEMNERIPNAELCTLVEGSHAALIEQPALINLRLASFITRHFGPRRPAGERRTGKGPAS